VFGVMKIINFAHGGFLTVGGYSALLVTNVGWNPWLSLPMAFGLVRRFWREPPGPAFNALLAQTAKFQVMFAALLCVALLLG